MIWENVTKFGQNFIAPKFFWAGTAMQWWILGEANEAFASGPPFFGGPPSILRAPPLKTAYTVLDSLSGRFGVKTFFFFFREHFDFGRKISKPRSDLFFFSDNINF